MTLLGVSGLLLLPTVFSLQLCAGDFRKHFDWSHILNSFGAIFSHLFLSTETNSDVFEHHFVFLPAPSQNQIRTYHQP